MEGRRNKKGRRKTAMRHTSPTSHNKRQVSTLQDHEFMARAVRVDSAVQVGLIILPMQFFGGLAHESNIFAQVLQKVLSQASEAINSISAPLTQMTTEKVNFGTNNCKRGILSLRGLGPVSAFCMFDTYLCRYKRFRAFVVKTTT